jgi:hypothetical protein
MEDCNLDLDNDIDKPVEQEADSELQAEMPPERAERNEKPALVINVQSWATPIVGVLMLVVGLLAGYFGRPLLSLGASAPESIAPAVVAAATPDAADQQSKEKMLAFLNEQTRHFKGDPNAKVTIIEFGDFQ